MPIRDILLGIRGAALAWMAYAIVEYVYVIVTGLLRQSSTMLAPWHWEVASVVFGSYLLISLPVGVASGIASRWNRRILDTAPGLSIVTLFLGHLVPRLEQKPEVYTAVAMGIVAALALPAWFFFGRIGIIRNPWVLSLALLAIPGVVEAAARLPEKRHLAVASVLLLLGVAVTVWISRRPGMWTEESPLRVGGALALVVLVSVVVSDAPPPVPTVANSAGAKGKPNVVLVVMDTVRAQSTSLHGYERPTTPFLEKLAAEATLFRRAISPADMTVPAHASMFTGLYPQTHGAHHSAIKEEKWLPLEPEFQTMAETLAKNGFSNAAVVANYAMLGNELGLLQGFLSVDDRRPIAYFGWNPRYHLQKFLDRAIRSLVPSRSLFQRTRRAEDINRDAFRLLDELADRGQPFFLFVNYMDAHEPYLPPAPYDSLFPGKDPWLTYTDRLSLREAVVNGDKEYTVAQHAHLLSQYDGGIAYLDLHIGRLAAHLRELGVYDETLLIVTSDHGEAFGEHQIAEHSVGVYQTQIGVPLLVKFPHQRAPRLVEESASLVDITPTVLSALGLEWPPTLHGVDLGGSFLDPSRRVSATYFPWPTLTRVPRRLERRHNAMLHEGWKLISPLAAPPECYHLDRDPNEENNLYQDRSNGCRQIERDLEAWLAELPELSRRGRELDPSALDKLRSLGYIR